MTPVAPARVVCVGECMLELTGSADAGYRLGMGGDTWNTAVYLARLGHSVRYLTALGDDPYSKTMRERWMLEGLDLSLVLTAPGRRPGLYAIQTDSAGERAFHYWRSESAARALFALPGLEAALAAAQDTDLLYLSGITLAIFGDVARERLAGLAASVLARGGKVAFDPNYRPLLWLDLDTARAAMIRFSRHVSIALPTFSDERALFGDRSPEATRSRWHGYGVPECAVKLGADGCMVADGQRNTHVPAVPAADPRDTTGAGDAFNAAYLAARLRGSSSAVAAEQGNGLASRVIHFAGALIPGDAMPPAPAS